MADYIYFFVINVSIILASFIANCAKRPYMRNYHFLMMYPQDNKQRMIRVAVKVRSLYEVEYAKQTL